MVEKTLGRYKIVGELGRGAMGAVYRAVDPLIEREVAIKTLLPNLPPDVMDEVRERFIREARSAGRLSHPNIVTIFDVGEQDGTAYIAMELLEGRSLQQMLRNSEPLPHAASADIAAQVADALDVAQHYKIAHRDVKPANIMIEASGRVKLTDFGVAHMPSSSMTQTGAALGSPKYMSPEQVLGLPVDPRCDIFALGVVLYEMLTRRTPFERDGDTTVFPLMHRIAGEPHVPVQEIDARIPAAFDRILDRALAKKPDERYARAAEMAQDLRNFRNLQAGEVAKPARARGSEHYEKTLVTGWRAPAAGSPLSPEDEKIRTQLITDLDKFAKDFEREEQARLREEEQERLRKEEALQRWAEDEERRREAFERSRATASTAGGSTDPGMQPAGARRAALDFLRQQAQTHAPPASFHVRPEEIAALDQALGAAYKYLAEVVKEMNSLSPTSPSPYEFLYLGKLPAVRLSDGFVDNRPVRLAGSEVCERISLRYRITPAETVKVSILGEDIARCIQYLKSLHAEYQAAVETRNAVGKVTKALFAVTGSLPCEITLRGDYRNPGAAIELVNVRRPGRIDCRVATEALPEVIDDLARYVLGVDDDFEKIPRVQQ